MAVLLVAVVIGAYLVVSSNGPSNPSRRTSTSSLATSSALTTSSTSTSSSVRPGSSTASRGPVWSSGAAMPSPRVLFAVGTLAVLCTALAFLLFFALIAEVGPVRATVVTYFNPAVALLLGVTLLHEPLTIGALIGLALILLGSFYATRRSSGPAAGAADRTWRPWAVAARYRRERLRRVQGSGK